MKVKIVLLGVISFLNINAFAQVKALREVRLFQVTYAEYQGTPSPGILEAEYLDPYLYVLDKESGIIKGVDTREGEVKHTTNFKANLSEHDTLDLNELACMDGSICLLGKMNSSEVLYMLNKRLEIRQKTTIVPDYVREQPRRHRNASRKLTVIDEKNYLEVDGTFYELPESFDPGYGAIHDLKSGPSYLILYRPDSDGGRIHVCLY